MPEIVDLFNTIHREESVLDNLVADSGRGGFHQNTNGVSQDAG